jgi:S-adenosylmethionine hydrolase
MPPPIITLTTDFGTADSFVGTMKGVILSIAPDAQIVDLTHDIPPQDVQAGAFAVASAYPYFPAGTIHVIVVDPGVGTQRLPIAVATGSTTFVCPDNGLLSRALDQTGARVGGVPFAMARTALPDTWHAVHLTNADYWHQPLSTTFHGRDIFAPVAAHLASGSPIESMGVRITNLVAFAVPQPTSVSGTSIGQVLHVDRFGNLTTNLRSSDLPQGQLEIHVGGKAIAGLSETYQDGGDLIALIGSGGTLEIAVRNGDASRALDSTVGAEVHVISRS